MFMYLKMQPCTTCMHNLFISQSIRQRHACAYTLQTIKEYIRFWVHYDCRVAGHFWSVKVTASSRPFNILHYKQGIPCVYTRVAYYFGCQSRQLQNAMCKGRQLTVFKLML